MDRSFQGANTLKKPLLILALSASFIVGTLVAGNLVFAAPADSQNELLSAILQEVQALVEDKETFPTDISVAATTSGELFIPRERGDAILFYGDTLCRITWETTFNLWIEFATTTTVEHMNVACPNVFGSSAPIVLDGAVDHTFEKGDRLVLSRYIGPQWDEVFRETP